VPTFDPEESAMDGPQRTMAWNELERRVGDDFGTSSWIAVTQPMIDAFAETTRDTYFLHVDPVRAAATPFGTTIAHGMLTLSLLPALGYEVCPFVAGARFPLNYGFHRVRFVSPVRVGSRVRGRFVLREAAQVSATQRQLRYDATVEIEGSDKPALVADWLTRFVL
jgi:acyl dehydratase